jgi:hypothetical protein
MTLTAWAVDELKSDAKVIRQATGSLIGSAGGLVAEGGLEITQKGTPNMSVQIKGGTPAEGGLWIPGYTSSTGPTYFQNSATYEQPIEAAGASNPRVDTIVARIYDTSLDSSGKHEPAIEALRGEEVTGAKLEGSKSKGLAALPKNCYVIGYVEVKAKVASIVTADIENVAEPVGLATTGKYQPVKTYTAAEGNLGIELSPTRPALATIKTTASGIEIGNVVMVGFSDEQPQTYWVNPGQKIKTNEGTVKISAIFL